MNKWLQKVNTRLKLCIKQAIRPCGDARPNPWLSEDVDELNGMIAYFHRYKVQLITREFKGQRNNRFALDFGV